LGRAATPTLLKHALSTWDSEQEANFPREALGDAIQQLVALGVQLDPAAIYETTE
jgi:hypothetical protein